MRGHPQRCGIPEKLGVTTAELCDCTTMAEIRRERGLGVQMPGVDDYTGMEAKLRIAELLNIRINSVERFKQRNGFK